MSTLLTELLIIKQKQTVASMIIPLFEDIGNLKDLGVGRLINAFKQQFHDRSMRGRPARAGESEVGNKFTNSGSRVGRDSEIEDYGVLVKIQDFRKIMRKYDEGKPDIVGCAVYVKNKPVAMVVGSSNTFSGINNVAGIAWDLSSLPEDKANKILDSIGGDLSYRDMRKVTHEPEKWVDVDADTKKKIPAKTTSTSAIKSEREKEERVWGGNHDKKKINQYQAIGLHVRDIITFIEALLKQVDSPVSLKLIRADVKAVAKARSRTGNVTEKTIDTFRKELAVRLAKYKASKLQSVSNLEELMAVITKNELKKIKLGDQVFNATPGDSTINAKLLMTGKPVAISFEGDRQANENYGSLQLIIKLVDGKLVPIKASYSDKGYKTVTVTEGK